MRSRLLPRAPPGTCGRLAARRTTPHRQHAAGRSDFRRPGPLARVSAVATLRKTERALKAAHSVLYRERLESAPGTVISTTWRQVAPDRMSYSIAGGSSAVLIGPHRWDRAAGSTRWLRSPQDPVSAPALPWGTDVRDVVKLDSLAGRQGKDLRLALFEPSIPAWYEVTVDAHTFHLRSVHMTAPSHFMRDDYVAYDGVAAIAPPSSR